MNWRISHRSQPSARVIADRHYSRQKPGTPQFVPPGRCVVFVATTGPAYWVTSWPFAEYVKHAWPVAWIGSAFRNEGAGLSSDLIRQAVAATRHHHLTEWAEYPMPGLGMVTFVDTKKTRHKRDPGRCFRKAGFRPCGWTRGGLFALQLLPHEMPEPEPPVGVTLCFGFAQA